MTERVHQSTFFAGIAWGLQTRHFTYFAPTRDMTHDLRHLAFNLSIEDAFYHTRYLTETDGLDVDLRFRILTDLHGESPLIRRMLDGWVNRGLAVWRDGYHLKLNDRVSPLRSNPIPKHIYLILVDELIANYQVAREQRCWVQWAERQRTSTVAS
jgi:hypothetical protein